MTKTPDWRDLRVCATRWGFTQTLLASSLPKPEILIREERDIQLAKHIDLICKDMSQYNVDWWNTGSIKVTTHRFNAWDADYTNFELRTEYYIIPSLPRRIYRALTDSLRWLRANLLNGTRATVWASGLPTVSTTLPLDVEEPTGEARPGSVFGAGSVSAISMEIPDPRCSK